MTIRTRPEAPFAPFRIIHPAPVSAPITTLLADARAFRTRVDELLQPGPATRSTGLPASEARGFTFLGGAVAHRSPPLRPIRKKHAAHSPTVRRAYSWNMASMKWRCMPLSVHPGERVILVDDLSTTRRHPRNARKLLRQIGRQVVAAGFINHHLPDLGCSAKLAPLWTFPCELRMRSTT